MPNKPKHHEQHKRKGPYDSILSLKPRITKIDTRQGSGAAVDRIRGWKLTKIRDRILLRDEYTCQRCRRVSVDLEIHHESPLHQGGQETDANRVSLCRECHAKQTKQEEKGRE